MNRGTFAPPVNLPFTAYGKAIKARDRLRVYIKKAVATKDGKGCALGVLKSARGPSGEQLSPAELEIELLHFYFAAHGGLTAALAWLLVVLGEHPEIAACLRAEADEMLSDGAADARADEAARRSRARGVARGAARVSDRADDVHRRREEGPRARRVSRSGRLEGRRCDLGDAAGRHDVRGSDAVRRRRASPTLR